MGNTNSQNTYNRNNQNSSQNSGIQQILFGLALVVVLYVSILFVEIMYNYMNRLSMNRTVLLGNTYNIEDKTVTIPQNPNMNSKIINVSNNERTGIEFSYSFYLFVHQSTFRQEYGLLHIFHKGYAQQFPLLAPGVYMRSDTNTLRVYMNTYKTWNNYVEVENIPIGKWVHTVIVCKENSLEVYINGNLSRKLSFDGFAPYQNYEDIICFSSRVIKLHQKNVQSADPEGFDVFGTMKGNLSRLEYFSYALCYAEIQQLMNKGPSNKSETAQNTDIPPYLDDTWWSQGY